MKCAIIFSYILKKDLLELIYDDNIKSILAPSTIYSYNIIDFNGKLSKKEEDLYYKKYCKIGSVAKLPFRTTKVYSDTKNYVILSEDSRLPRKFEGNTPINIYDFAIKSRDIKAGRTSPLNYYASRKFLFFENENKNIIPNVIILKEDKNKEESVTKIANIYKINYNKNSKNYFLIDEKSIIKVEDGNEIVEKVFMES